MKKNGNDGKGHIKKYFPGSNSAYGFYSFYDQIIADDATRKYIIKGGPGVGKSTFMRSIAERYLGMGYDLEFHCCSSDNDSLDGIVIPLLGIACIDGTAPHTVDPRNPGVVDEIIHLGDFWDEKGILRHRKAILKTNREKSRLFRRAYKYLAAAKLFLDEVEGYYIENNALDKVGLDKLALQLNGEIFQDRVNEHEGDGPIRRERHMFATAITPEGPISYLESLLSGIKKKYIINGDDGTGKNDLISRVMDAAKMRGYYVEIYHCALDPYKIDHVIIPELEVAVLNSVTPHILHPGPEDTVVETGHYTRDPGAELLQERKTARELYHRSMDTAVSFFHRAKAAHDELESYYIPNMNFEDIDRLRHQIIKKINSYAGDDER